VANDFIDAMRAGTAPWQRPWSTACAFGTLPMNPTTGNRYRGANSLYLMMAGHDDPRWLTYKQAEAAGAQVRRGERSTALEFCQWDVEKEGEDGVVRSVRLERPHTFPFWVFNAEQVDGLPPLVITPLTWDPHERTEALLQASGARIDHVAGDRAYYSPSSDRIVLPLREQFADAGRWAATALHELGHWTGHSSRLDRQMGSRHDVEAYAKEELIAEISSLMVGADLGIGHDPGQHHAYVASWIKALQDDPREIFRAAAAAEKVRTFVMAFDQHLEQTQNGVATANTPSPRLEQPAPSLVPPRPMELVQALARGGMSL